MSTFNAGAIEANLTLGRSAWTRDLKKTQKEIADLEKKSITIGVDLDTDNARVAMDNLELFLEDLDNSEYKPSVDLVVREAMEALEALEARLEALDARRVVVELDADATNAEIVLDNLENDLLLLENNGVTVEIDADAGKAQATMLELMLTMQRLEIDGVDINVDVDGFGKAVTQLNILEAQVDMLDGREIDLDVDIDRSALNDLVGPPGGDGSGGHIGLLRMLIYSLIALSPILAVSMSSATAAIVAFGAAVAGAAVPVLVLAGGLAGLVGRYKEAQAAGEEMTGPMADFAAAISEVKEAWDAFLDAIAPAGFTLMAQALELVADILPTLAPLFNATAEALGGVLGGIRGFVESSEYQEMIDFFSGFGVDMLVQFLNIGGNLLQFFGRLFQAIEPFARAMMSGLEEVTAGWAAWADDLENNDSFQQFMDNALEYGPMVLDMLGSLIQAFMNIGRALEPFAGPMLEGLTMFFDLIANADPTVLSVIIGALGGLWLGLNVLAPAIAAVSTGLSVLGAALGIATGPLLLILGAIALVGAAIWYLWETNETFREAVIATWDTIWATLEPIVMAVVALFMENWPAIQEFAMQVWTSVSDIIMSAMLIIMEIVTRLTEKVQFIWKHFGDDIMFIIRNTFQTVAGVIRAAFQIIQGIFQVFSGILTGNWDRVFDGLLNIVRGTVNMVVTVFRSLVQNALGIVGGIKSAFNGVIDYFKGLPGKVSTAVKGLFNGIKDNFKDVINGIIGIWNDLSFTVDIPDKIPGLPDEWKVSTPNVPELADGAYLTEATLNIAGEAGPEIVAPEPVLERIVRDNSGANLDHGRIASAVAVALAEVLGRMGVVTKEDMERLIEAAAVNLNIDARSDHEAAGRLASAIGFELRLLGYGGKANV